MEIYLKPGQKYRWHEVMAMVPHDKILYMPTKERVLLYIQYLKRDDVFEVIENEIERYKLKSKKSKVVIWIQKNCMRIHIKEWFLHVAGTDFSQHDWTGKKRKVHFAEPDPMTENIPINISSLSEDVMEYMFQFLEIPDLIHLQRTCSEFYDKIEGMWSILLQSHFSRQDPNPKQTFKTLSGVIPESLVPKRGTYPSWPEHGFFIEHYLYPRYCNTIESVLDFVKKDVIIRKGNIPHLFPNKIIWDPFNFYGNSNDIKSLYNHLVKLVQ